MVENKPVRILYMEDDAGLARLLQRKLQRQSFSVEIVRNGDDGLATLGKAPFDVVLLDYSMPSCDGIDVLRVMAECKTSPPVIMLTGRGNEKIAVEALQLGASDYIVKDVDMGYLELLPVVIDQVLQKQQLIREREQMLKALQESEDRYRKLSAQLERMVLERTAELQTSNRELEVFCYSVSHDLSAPLRTINGFSEVLLEEYGDRLDNAGRRCLSKIGAAATQMVQLIDALLDLSTMATDEPHLEPVNLSDLAGEIAQELHDLEQQHKVDIRITGGMEVEGDPALLRVMMENLLGNAWKFSRTLPDACIEFGKSFQNGEMVYYVRDNGIGFDLGNSGKLIDLFQRLHLGDEFKGIGIGLATVQRIVERHNGRIWAESEVGKGATFYFTLSPIAN
ncbi:sensor histidine kinase [Geobacter grbiciae]|uniref:sensor histidine kinase n=1 Tax=Geobacter grbiciae TaxID=155042 RepID=UPI001C017DBA|nr:response regulator [Geobacter grbiciae]